MREDGFRSDLRISERSVKTQIETVTQTESVDEWEKRRNLANERKKRLGVSRTYNQSSGSSSS